MARKKPRPQFDRRKVRVGTRTKKINVNVRWVTGSTGGGLGSKGSRARNRTARTIRKNRREYSRQLKELLGH